MIFDGRFWKFYWINLNKVNWKSLWIFIFLFVEEMVDFLNGFCYDLVFWNDFVTILKISDLFSKFSHLGSSFLNLVISGRASKIYSSRVELLKFGHLGFSFRNLVISGRTSKYLFFSVWSLKYTNVIYSKNSYRSKKLASIQKL